MHRKLVIDFGQSRIIELLNWNRLIQWKIVNSPETNTKKEKLDNFPDKNDFWYIFNQLGNRWAYFQT